MKTKILSQVLVLFLILMVSGCSRHQGSDLNLLRVKGPILISNFSISELFSFTREDSLTGIMVRDGDMLLMAGPDESNSGVDFLVQYSSKMGSELSFRSDSTHYYALFMNNRLCSLAPDGDDAWQWIKSQPADAFSELNTLQLILPLNEEEMNILTKIAGYKNKINLQMEIDHQTDQVATIIDMFNPGYVSLAGNREILTEKVIAQLNRVKTIVLDGVKPTQQQLSALVNTEELILQFESEELDTRDFSSMKKLNSLTLRGANNLVKTSELTLPEKIKTLNLISCNDLTDISSLNQMRDLKYLNLNRSNNVKDVSTLHGMKLEWLAPPPAINQEQFDTLMANLPALKALELFKCDSLTNLDILGKMHLRSLSVHAEGIDLASLPQMDELELFVFEHDNPLTKDEVATLQPKMQKALIVPGDGFCMGSGWLLLLVPIVLIMVLFVRRRL